MRQSYTLLSPVNGVKCHHIHMKKIWCAILFPNIITIIIIVVGSAISHLPFAILLLLFAGKSAIKQREREKTCGKPPLFILRMLVIQNVTTPKMYLSFFGICYCIHIQFQKDNFIVSILVFPRADKSKNPWQKTATMPNMSSSSCSWMRNWNYMRIYDLMGWR